MSTIYSRSTHDAKIKTWRSVQRLNAVPAKNGHAQYSQEAHLNFRSRSTRRKSSNLKVPNVLKYATPSELSSFSNNPVHHEVATYCPLWHSALVGAMGPCKKEDKAAKAVNVTSLCSAAVAKFRNQRMSAYAHRISLILIHSGAKSQDFRRLNQLGIFMSHGETIKKQKEMARAHDAAVLIWKKDVEFSKKCMLLLQEIQKRQVPVFEEDDMEVEIILDLSLPTVSSYEHYTEQAFAKCLQVINKELSTAGNSVATDETLEMALKAASGEFVSLPKYR